MLALLPDEFLITINSLELLGIIYLAIAVSKLRAELANVQGRLEQHERELDREANTK